MRGPITIVAKVSGCAFLLSTNLCRHFRFNQTFFEKRNSVCWQYATLLRNRRLRLQRWESSVFRLTTLLRIINAIRISPPPRQIKILRSETRSRPKFPANSGIKNHELSMKPLVRCAFWRICIQIIRERETSRKTAEAEQMVI